MVTVKSLTCSITLLTTGLIVFARSIMLPDRSEVSQSAITPCRLQLWPVYGARPASCLVTAAHISPYTANHIGQFGKKKGYSSYHPEAQTYELPVHWLVIGQSEV
jgi:hypothetical protein